MEGDPDIYINEALGAGMLPLQLSILQNMCETLWNIA